jgi:hypothetical protein
MARGQDAAPSVTHEDFAEALVRLQDRVPAGVT